MNKQDCISTAYQPLGGGYAYASLRVGLVIRNPQGREIFCQPGDDENIMRENLDALGELSLDCDEPKRAMIADIMLSDYFA